jgi:hypothetical protein
VHKPAHHCHPQSGWSPGFCPSFQDQRRITVACNSLKPSLSAAPVFATVLSLLIVLVGAVSFNRLTVCKYPKIDEPVVTECSAAPAPG